MAKKERTGNTFHVNDARWTQGRIWRGRPILDLDYAEDREAETDMNVVMNENDGFVEIQGTAEGHAFRASELDAMLSLARAGIGGILEAQRRALGE